MDHINYTAFKGVAFDTLGPEDVEYHVAVIRATFDIVPGGELRQAEEQEPLAVADQYYGKPNLSSVRQESDFAPYKPKTDIILDAVAHAPGGKPSPGWKVTVRVGEHTKSLIVTGPRKWIHKLLMGWELSPAQPVASLPIRYEYAYGGTVTVYDKSCKEDRTGCLMQNPVGAGYCPKWAREEAKKKKEIPAPQILSPQDGALEFGKDYALQGFGPVGRAWLPRRAFAGAYDDEWLRERHPKPPLDFDYAYWNGAHPDLQVPFLQGGEDIELTHLTPDGKLAFRLPGNPPFVLVRYRDGNLGIAQALLDTLFIEPERMKATLVWRATVKSEPEVRMLEIRREEKAQTKEAAHG